MAGYFVKIKPDGRAQGPFSGAQLRTFATQGKLKPEHLISQDQMKWVQASSVKKLGFAASTAPRTSVCPQCGAEMQPEAVICVQCGTDLRTRRPATSPGEEGPLPGRIADADTPTGSGRRLPSAVIWIGRVAHLLSFLIMAVIALSLTDDPLGEGEAWAVAGAVALGCGALALLLGGLKLKGGYQSFFVIAGPILAAAMIVVWLWMRLAIRHVSFGTPFSGESGETTRVGAVGFGAVILVALVFGPGLLALFRQLASSVSCRKAVAVTVVAGAVLVVASTVALVPKVRKDAVVANRERSKMNLGWLCKMAEQYRDHHSKYPGTMAELRDFGVKEHPRSSVCFENPRGGSYRIIGRPTYRQKSLIWFYEGTPQLGERAVAFRDGHVEMLQEKEFASGLLLAAAWCGRLDLVEELVAKGTDVNTRDEGDLTPLHYTDSRAVAAFLIDKGAEVNAKDGLSRTPLHDVNDKELVALLIHKGAEVNAKDRFGKTPLHTAAMWGHKEAMALLIENGAHMNARDKDGKTPLDVAQSEEVIQLLRKHSGLR